MNEDLTSNRGKGAASTADWKEIVLQCQKPSTWRAIWQIVNTLGPYALLWYLMYRSEKFPKVVDGGGSKQGILRGNYFVLGCVRFGLDFHPIDKLHAGDHAAE